MGSIGGFVREANCGGRPDAVFRPTAARFHGTDLRSKTARKTTTRLQRFRESGCIRGEMGLNKIQTANWGLPDVGAEEWLAPESIQSRARAGRLRP